jgi:hypothetical protein
MQQCMTCLFVRSRGIRERRVMSDTSMSHMTARDLFVFRKYDYVIIEYNLRSLYSLVCLLQTFALLIQPVLPSWR